MTSLEIPQPRRIHAKMIKNTNVYANNRYIRACKLLRLEVLFTRFR